MVRVLNVSVYDLKESVIASGNAMRLHPVEYSDEEFQKGLKRMVRLCKASRSGDIRCHDNALTGIRVSFDIVYPQYWTPEFQRYHFADIVTSSSKMHRLLKMNLDNACNKYVSEHQIQYIQHYIDLYNHFVSLEEQGDNVFTGYTFTLRDGTVINCNTVEDALYTCWMIILSNCPLGLELFMRVSTNYKQLQTIYFQRKHHKLKEDWGAFCKMIEGLPYFHELILGQEIEHSGDTNQ